MSVDRYWVKILNPDNDLRRSLAFGGRPWKVEVERAYEVETWGRGGMPTKGQLLNVRYVLEKRNEGVAI